MRQTSADSIRFHYMVPARIPAGKLKSLVARVLKDFGKVPISLNYIFCSDDYLLEINKKYLGHNSLTDIITFDLSEEADRVVADIYISAERVRDNARLLGYSMKNEFSRVIIHGALHLVGLKDKARREKVMMREAEDKYLALLLQESVPRETKAKNKFHVKHRKGVS